jgi:hypothetical protein
MQVELTTEQIERLISTLRESDEWKNKCLASYLEQYLRGKQVWISNVDLDEIPF